MPRHATSLGTGNFPAASKLLQRYEQDRAYKMHQQKMHHMRHRLDTEPPKKHNHLLLRLKQVQKDEERQAQIDYENKLLLTKMTTIMKYGGNLDNYNNYEIRSLNYPHRNKVNDEILRENIGIAKRLETVKPQYQLNKWEKQYQQHAYLKRLWNGSVKDFGEFTPRRMSRMSKAVKRSMDDSLDEDFTESEVATEDGKKLPKLGGKYKSLRATQSETDGPISSRRAGPQGGTKLPKIIPHKHRIKRIRKYQEEKKKEENDSKSSTNESKSSRPKDKQKDEYSEESPYSSRQKEKSQGKDKDKANSKKSVKSDKDNGKNKTEHGNGDSNKLPNVGSKSMTSVQSANVRGNDMERVKTLISEEKERGNEDETDKQASNDNSTADENANESIDIQNVDNSDKQGSDNQNKESKDTDSFFDEKDDNQQNKNQNNDKEVKDENKQISENSFLESEKHDRTAKEGSENNNELHSGNETSEKEANDITDERKTNAYQESQVDDKNEKSDDSQDKDTEKDTENVETKQVDEEKNGTDEMTKHESHDSPKKPKKDKHTSKGHQKKNKEDGTSGATGKEDTTDVAQLFKIAKQLGRPEDIFIKTLIKKTHKQRMATKAKFRQKYDLDLISELKTGLGLQWELLIKELLEDRCFADALAVFDAMCDLEGKKTMDVSDVVEVLCTRNNAAMAELKESYRKEFSLTLEEDIIDRTKDSVQTLLLALQKGERDETPEPDLSQCNDDAFALYESGDGRWTSDSGLFMRLITQRSPQHMQCVLNEYKTVSGGQEILDAIKEECPRDFFLSVKTYVNCTRSPATYFADQLHSNKLPSNPVFVATLVGRSEIDMPAIRKAYKKKYHIDLVEDIKNFSYPTTKCLMELAAKVPPVKKDFQTKKFTKAQPTQQTPQSQPISQAKKGVAAAKTTGAQPTTHKEPQQQKSKEPAKKAGTQQPQQTTKSKQGEAGDNQATKGDNQVAKTAPKPKETVTNNGTVKPASNFNAEDDCEKLNRAMSYDDGADETVVVAILPKRSNKQRQEIKKVYEQKYKKNLMIDLESELQGDTEEIVFALLMTPTEYDAYVVHKAVEEMGTSELTLIGILCTRSSKELKAIKDYYRQAYKSDMEKDISGDCRGDYGDLIMALCKTEREPGSDVNREQAKKDAQEMYKDGSLDLKGETFKTLVTQRNQAQVHATYMEYEKLAGQDIYTAISQVMNEDDDGYLLVAKAVGDPVLFYTEAINSCFKGMVNDNLLIRTIVPRSEIDLLDIKAKYVELSGKGLWDTVNREVTASHKNLLLAIINKDAKRKKSKQQTTNTNQKVKANKDPAGPTVKPVQPFDPDTDCKRLHEAMDGLGTNEDVIIDIIPHRSNKQRQDLKLLYQEKYGRKLEEDLESELNGDFEEIVLALMMTPTQYDAYCLHDAIEGLGTTESVLIGILSTRSPQELEAIKQRYKEEYGKDLSTDIKSDTSFGLEDMLVGLLAGERDQSTIINRQEAQDDARKLYKDGQISIDPEDDTFKEILVKKNRAQIRATFEEYKQMCGNDIYYGIEKAFIGDTSLAYKGLAKAIEDPVQFYAERLFASMKGAGTNDKMLIRIIVSRSEIDLEDIKVRYHSLYKQTLAQSVQDECRGDYKKILLDIIGDTTDEQTDEQVDIQTDATHTPNKTTEEKVKESKQKATTKKTKTKTHKNVTVTNKYNKKAKGSRKLKVNLPSATNVEKQKDEPRPDSNESAYETDNEDTNETKSEMKYDSQYNITVNNDENITNEKDCQTNKNEYSSDQRRSNDEKCHENEINNVSKQHTNDDENITADNDRDTVTGNINKDDNKEMSSPTRTGDDEKHNENEIGEAQKQVNNDENIQESKDDDGEYKIEVKYRTRDNLGKINQAKDHVSETGKTDLGCKIVEVKYRTRDNINQENEQSAQEDKGNRTTSDLQASETTMTTTRKTTVTKHSKETSKTVKDSKSNKVVNSALDNSKDETKCKKEKQNQNEKKHKTKKKNNIENENKIKDDDLGESGNEDSISNEDTKGKRPKTADVGTECGIHIDKEDGDIFSPDEDCIKLHEAIHGKKKDKDTVNHLLSTRSMTQRLDMAHAYKVRHDKDVLDDIRSEFKGDYRDLCTALLQDQTTQDAELINYAVKGLGTNEMALTHILASRSPQPGERPTQDHEDALIEILTSFNKQQFASVCHIYQKITGLLLKEAITQSTKGDFRDALLTMASVLEDSMNYYTETLHKSMKGFRNNDRVLINIVISRAETDLQQIDEAFNTKHGKTLHQAVTSNYRRDFADLLLQLIEQNQTGQ